MKLNAYRITFYDSSGQIHDATNSFVGVEVVRAATAEDAVFMWKANQEGQWHQKRLKRIEPVEPEKRK